MENNFADRLIDSIIKKKSPVVCGLDPVYEKIPAFIREKYHSTGAAIFAFNKMIIEAVYDIVPAVKPQLAYYESYGVTGMVAFKSTVDYARSKGLLVIADGKRNDIGSTSEAYARAYLEKNASDTSSDSPLKEGSFDADALTVNPYLGEDGVKPFADACLNNGRGIFVLVKTSNKSSGQLQDLKTEDGREIYKVVAELVNQWGEATVGSHGYSSIGAVVGATYPQQAEILRKVMPKTIFLVPGYGAQGGDSLSVRVNFNSDGLGAVINASRSIMYAYKNAKWNGRFSEQNFAEASREEVLDMNRCLSF